MDKALNFDPFGPDTSTDANKTAVVEETLIHLYVQQRTTRAMTTTVIGLSENLGLKDLVKKIKKQYCCSGFIANDKERKMLRFSGDQRANISDFLITNSIVKDTAIKIHGY